MFENLSPPNLAETSSDLPAKFRSPRTRLPLVSQMTLEEKADFCSGKDFWHLPGLERLQIPSIMVTDGPHGLRKQGQNADHLGAHRSIHDLFPNRVGPSQFLGYVPDGENWQGLGRYLRG